MLGYLPYLAVCLQIIHPNLAIRKTNRECVIIEFETTSIISIEISAQLSNILGSVQIDLAVKADSDGTQWAPVQSVEIKIVPDIGHIKYFLRLSTSAHFFIPHSILPPQILHLRIFLRTRLHLFLGLVPHTNRINALILLIPVAQDPGGGT